jgi:hypothetical protein
VPPAPLHIDAAKIRIAQRCRDYFVADHLYACLAHGERKTINDLKEYLDRGRDPGSGQYDKTTRLDLETLTVLKLVEDLGDLHLPVIRSLSTHRSALVRQESSAMISSAFWFTGMLCRDQS